MDGRCWDEVFEDGGMIFDLNNLDLSGQEALLLTQVGGAGMRLQLSIIGWLLIGTFSVRVEVLGVQIRSSHLMRLLACGGAVCPGMMMQHQHTLADK